MSDDEGTRIDRQTVRLWISWLLVSALLGYGVIQTAQTAARLFTQ